MTELNLDEVRAKAKELGVKYHPANKAETIQENIDIFLAGQGADVDALVEQVKEQPKAESPAQKEAKALRDAVALIPITITTMDPADAQIPCVIASVGNSKLGQITKVIPVGHKWYMPKMLVDHLAEQKYLRHTMVPRPSGGERLESTYLPKYGIQYHPMPTPEDLADLAKLQLQGNELAKSG